jgi:hypothetical protein
MSVNDGRLQQPKAIRGAGERVSIRWQRAIENGPAAKRGSESGKDNNGQ